MNSNLFNLLIVDDDPLIHQAMKTCIGKPWNIISTQDPNSIPDNILFHAAFVDMHLFKNSMEPIGIKVIEKLHKYDPNIEIVAMSGVIDRKTMESCLIAGAQKFLAKPLTMEEINALLDKILAHWQIRNFDPNAIEKHSLRWIGKSTASQKVIKQIAELRGEKKSILIEGETGTGKEVVAKLLHLQESDSPFIAVNLASIPENLFESEMFGHIKGAFTGADQNKIGLIEAAHGGDLFLDELEALPLSFQVKLLRFLESGEIRKVGSKDTIKIQTRIIAASNKPFSSLVNEGLFREDLYYRLSSQKIDLPPLRERTEDIELLAKYFLDTEKPRRNKQFDKDGIEALVSYYWPGNVRELKRICEQLSLTSPLPFIRSIDVIPFLAKAISKQNNSSEIPLDLSSPGPIDYNLGLDRLLSDYEKKILVAALDMKNKDVEKTSNLLKISKSNLYKKIKDYKIES